MTSGTPRIPLRAYDLPIIPPKSSSRAQRGVARQIARRRRRAALVAGALAAAALVGGLAVGASSGDEESEPSAAPVEETVELPRGGTELLPGNLLVGFYGAPQDEALGALGIGSPAEASAALAEQAKAYAGNRPILPFLELIATVANADPGDDGLYRTQQPRSVIEDYLDQARAGEELLVLDVQPGGADFADEVDRLEPYLSEPDVGLALDPEWHVPEGVAPGTEIGSMTAEEVNEIAARLSQIVTENNLPQKLLIVHRFTEDMITNPRRLEPHPGVALVLNVDGFGTPPDKIVKYEDLQAPRGSGFYSGFKLFYLEDTDLMSPDDVLSLKQKPDIVIYE